MRKILLIEDEIDVVNFVKRGLTEEGYAVSIALDGITGYQMVMENTFDLVILDIMLPNKNGLEVCKDLRDSNIQTPILFLTALSTAENIAIGLNSGADDYLIKPFKFIELNARIKALIRRIDKMEDIRNDKTSNIYYIADLKLDDTAKIVSRNDVPIILTATEYRLLLALIQSKGRVLSRMDLLESAWDINFNVGTNVVDVYINYLRKKIEGSGENKLIHTIFGMGYVLKES